MKKFYELKEGDWLYITNISIAEPRCRDHEEWQVRGIVDPTWNSETGLFSMSIVVIGDYPWSERTFHVTPGDSCCCVPSTRHGYIGRCSTEQNIPEPQGLTFLSPGDRVYWLSRRPGAIIRSGLVSKIEYTDTFVEVYVGPNKWFRFFRESRDLRAIRMKRSNTIWAISPEDIYDLKEETPRGELTQADIKFIEEYGKYLREDLQ